LPRLRFTFRGGNVSNAAEGRFPHSTYPRSSISEARTAYIVSTLYFSPEKKATIESQQLRTPPMERTLHRRRSHNHGGRFSRGLDSHVFALIGLKAFSCGYHRALSVCYVAALNLNEWETHLWCSGSQPDNKKREKSPPALGGLLLSIQRSMLL